MTGRTGYTGPTDGDDFDAAGDMTAIYGHFDPLIGETATTVSALPASGNWKGRTILVIDTSLVYVNMDGAVDWRILGSAGVVTFTPSWTGYTRGNGTASGYFGIHGGICEVFVSETLGSTSSAAGPLLLTTPVTTAFAQENQHLGEALFFNTSATGRQPGGVFQTGTPSSVAIRPIGAASTYADLNANAGGTVPFGSEGFGTGDKISIHFSFPVI